MSRSLAQLKKIPVTELKGVGKAKAYRLNEFGIDTVLDLLMHYPRRYLDLSSVTRIRDVKEGELALVVGEVVKVGYPHRTRSGKSMLSVDIGDFSGILRCTFFNQPWRAKQLEIGVNVACYGKVTLFGKYLQMSSPSLDLYGDNTGKVVALYPSSAKSSVTTKELSKFISETLERAGEFEDPLSKELLEELNLVDRTFAFRAIHKPTDLKASAMARKRLAFDELLRLQLPLIQAKRQSEKVENAISHKVSSESDSMVQRFLKSLDFELTNAQKNALEEIFLDMSSKYPMHRLLQGDVGSGKTVVALGALVLGIENGYQGAIMAPTEVLAEQHYSAICSMLRDFEVLDPSTLSGTRGLRVCLLTSKITGASRSEIIKQIGEGSVDLIVGTHAILSESVAFKSLGIVVIDEQHRFGVEQRSALRTGNSLITPDMLVMTATPIPRSAAMVIFGDLEQTTLSELPLGRKPVETKWAKTPSAEKKVWDKVRSEVKKGHLVYVVCPLVEGSDRIEAKSAVEEFERLAASELASVKVGLVHGQMPASKREETMRAFRSHEYSVLVATTVIEVGIDIKDATVMVIENADRFGIAQLHQLRGRVGRSELDSFCFLIADKESISKEAQIRLESIESISDGFKLAEIDLDLRGEGTILGARQKGRSDLRLASLTHDQELIDTAKKVANRILDEDPLLNTTAAGVILEKEGQALLPSDDEAYLFKS